MGVANDEVLGAMEAALRIRVRTRGDITIPSKYIMEALMAYDRGEIKCECFVSGMPDPLAIFEHARKLEKAAATTH